MIPLPRLKGRSRLIFSAILETVALGVVLVTFLGCRDSGKASAEAAAKNIDALVQLVEKDVDEVKRGLPEGAKKMTALYAKEDLNQDLPSIRRGLQRVRRETPDLDIAKSTFFAVADPKGIVLRNDLEQDAMAGQDLFRLFPDIAHADDQPFASATGAFSFAPGPNGPDKDWIAVSPIAGSTGARVALLVTGWSYRYFARHLQETLKRQLQDKLKQAGDTKMPIVYVGVFDASGTYLAPGSPSVNEKALSEAGFISKTNESSVYRGVLTITDREFGYAAKRVPGLGRDAGIVLLRSEI